MNDFEIFYLNNTFSFLLFTLNFIILLFTLFVIYKQNLYIMFYFFLLSFNYKKYYISIFLILLE